MSRNFAAQRGPRPKDLDHRTLRLEPLEPRLVLGAAAHFLGLADASLAAYVRSLDRDGSINRADMIAILRKVQDQPSGIVDAADMRDLRKIVQNSAKLKMPNYVTVLASDVVLGNPANAHYQGATLGNLAAGDPCTKLGDLTDKWFYGADLPPIDSTGLPKTDTYSYATASGVLYSPAGPSHLDEKQGYLGDCYLIAAMGSVADKSKASVRNMFIDNGDGTFTVRFYYNSKADYVTVTRELAISDSLSTLVFDGCGSLYSDAGNVLWLPLLEKAYVQWNETGRTGQGNHLNSYQAIASGWMGDVYRQAVGYSSIYSMATSASNAAPAAFIMANLSITTGGNGSTTTVNAKTTLIYTVSHHYAVTIGTNSTTDFSGTGLHGNHAYNILSYNNSTGEFILYNPWGHDQPYPLTWAQLRQNTDRFAVFGNVAVYVDGWHPNLSAEFLGAATVTQTSTLDKQHDPPPPAAPLATSLVDEALAAWDGRQGNALWRTAMKSHSSASWLSDVAANSAEKSSGNAFADVDALIDSIHWHVALVL
jgi:hypothetical protein